MKQFLCFSCEPWRPAPTRTQQLLSRMREAEILFFEPPAPGGGTRKPGRKVRPGLTVYTLPPILEVEERHAYLFRRNQAKLARFVEEKMARHRFREPALWLTDPRQVHLLDYLAYRGLVYDCDRDWTHLPLRWESDLALAADVIFAASPQLADHLSPCNDNICLLPNGANYPMFSREDTEVPPELRGVAGPLLGYVGTVWRDLDLTPVWKAARQHPEWAFLFVGRLEERNPLLGELQALPNVAFTGWRPLVELPDYLGRVDVCLNLYRRREVGGDVVPQRLYEYLSTGKPIVSMLWEDQVETFPDVISGAHTHAEFIRMCERALEETDDWARRRRRDYGRAAAWSERAGEVCRILRAIGLY